MNQLPENQSSVFQEVPTPVGSVTDYQIPESVFEFHPINAADGWTKNREENNWLSDPAIIDGMLREREVATIVGGAKTSKTWIALALALAVSEGRPFLGRSTTKRSVLYLDYELKRGTLQSRINQLAPSKPGGFVFECFRGKRGEELPRPENLRKEIEDKGYGLVVIDSLYKTGWVQEENSNDSTPQDLAVLQGLVDGTGASLLVIDHTAKGGGAEKNVVDAARGASAKGGFYDALFVLREPKTKPEEEGTFVELDAAFRDWPACKSKPLVRIGWDWSKVEATVERVGEIEKGGESTNARALRAVFEADPSKAWTKRELAEQTGISESSITRALEEIGAVKGTEKGGASGTAALFKLPPRKDAIIRPDKEIFNKLRQPQVGTTSALDQLEAMRVCSAEIQAARRAFAS